MKLKIREGMKISDSGMVIDVRTEDCLYIRINGWTYYIDDSTDEQITDKWVRGTEVEYPEKCSNLDYNLTNKLNRFKELSPELQLVLIGYINSIASCSGLFNERNFRNKLEKENDLLHEECRRELNKSEIIQD